VRAGLSRFAAVGALATATDIALFLALWQWVGLGIALADAIALAVAAGVSYALHRAGTFRDDPYDRWLDRLGDFVVAAVLAGAVDVFVVLVVTGARAPATFGDGVAAKLIAVVVAGVVRWVLNRRVLFSVVREEQGRRDDRPLPPGDARLTVVIPAYTEEARIGTTVARVRTELASVASGGAVEIVVVDDGSPDGTAAAARAAGADQVVVQPRNQGKGAAVRAGMLAARGRTVAFTDADLAYAPAQLARFVDDIEAGWDMVVGSRRHAATTTLVRARRLREIGGRAINWLTHVVLLGHYRDTQCGLKAFRSDVAREMFARSRIDGFAFDVELFVMAERSGLSVVEVPVQVENSPRSTVKVARDAARLVRDLFRIRRWARRGAYQFDPASGN
jgi:putative flippase GtrA